MPFPAFAPPVPPLPGDVTVEPRLLKARFGDGYTQETADGLNFLREQWGSVTWENLTDAECRRIVDFFRERGGYRPFRYRLPGQPAARLYKCRRWSETRVAFDVKSIQAVFEQAFDPEAS